MEKSSAVSVFKSDGNEKNVREISKKIERSKVYDAGIIERLFPSTVHKCSVTQELVVKNGKVDADIEFIAPEVVSKIDKEKFNCLHIGCVAVIIAPLGRKMKGNAKIECHDGRLKEGMGLISKFQTDLEKGLSAFADFPNFCVAIEDIAEGFSMRFKIVVDGLDFKDGTHPISVNVVSVVKAVDDELETKFLLKEFGGRRMYQPILNSKAVQDNVVEDISVDFKEYSGDTSLMPEVEDTIKRFGFKTKLLKDGTERSGREPGDLKVSTK